MKIEIVAYTVDGAVKAQVGGADRIELCANPGDGGTTPSFGVIKQVRQLVNIDLFVMIRPRGGDFHYSNEEYHAMRADIEACQKLSVDGVVLGMLNSDGTIDKKGCQKLIDLARPLKVTCHRAFDMTRDPFEALEDCISVGFDRILSSGLKPKASEGIGVLSELVNRADGRIVIMPGSGVNEDTVQEIVRKTKASEFHLSAMTHVESKMAYRNPSIAGMGSEEGAEYLLRTVDPTRIQAIRQLIVSVR